jgi:hypothetical protein
MVIALCSENLRINACIYDNMSFTGDHRPVYIKLDGILYATSSANVISIEDRIFSNI